jgi:hypothetical protein
MELSPNFGDGTGSGGSGLSLRSGDLDSVGELYTEDLSVQAIDARHPGFFA